MRNKLAFLTVLFALVALPGVALAQQPPQLPHVFYGTAEMQDGQVPAGETITAHANGNTVGSITLETPGKYGGSGAYDEKLLVQGDSLSNGDEITFRVGATELEANETVTYESGKVEELPLTFPFSLNDLEPESEEDSGNTDSGSTGGGGGTTTTTDTDTDSGDEETAITADIDDDGSVGVLDFNTLMVNWGDNPDNDAADLTGDGTVDILDFNTLIVNWTA